MTIQQERAIIRELAKEYKEITADERNNERYKRAKGINDLRVARPIVWLDEIPWHEVDIDEMLLCRCESEEAKEIETWLRRQLYRWTYIQADMVAEPVYRILKAYDSTGIGMDVWEDVLITDASNHIISHHYKDQLETDEQVNQLKIPIITARPDLDERKVNFAQEMLDEVLPVRLCGHLSYHAPWDEIPRLRGVEPILIDIVDRPEHLHKIRKFFMDAGISTYEQMERQSLLDVEASSLHCTPPYTDDLPAADYSSGSIRMNDTWFRGMAQMFSTVSPQVFKEFELDYMQPLMERFGLCYYGCCEPLDDRLALLKGIPNMRKLGVTPWANIRSSAEQIGKDYVFAFKPNPALVGGMLDEEAIRRETIETVEACLAYGCPYELVLKDISTVSYKPQNLISWVQIVEDVLDRYY